jgi:RNA ligase
MIKYPSIGQLRNVVHKIRAISSFDYKTKDGEIIYKKNVEFPTLQYKGTVKLHGTCSSVVVTPKKKIKIQSRNRIIDIHNDNNGFARFVTEEIGENVFISMAEGIGLKNDPITFFGEWCGSGIQKGVGICQLEKMFVIFSIRIGKNEKTTWNNNTLIIKEMLPKRIFVIDQFPTYKVDIDFNTPKLIQNKLVENTNNVEKECPVAKYFGVSGFGEGIVYKCETPGYKSSDYWFKVKGAKHQTSKVKKLAKVDTEKLATVNDFVKYVITENRLNQGIEYFNEMKIATTIENIGKFISWVFCDVMKEENDTMASSGLVKKDVSKSIAIVCKKWYFDYLDKLV